MDQLLEIVLDADQAPDEPRATTQQSHGGSSSPVDLATWRFLGGRPAPRWTLVHSDAAVLRAARLRRPAGSVQLAVEGKPWDSAMRRYYRAMDNWTTCGNAAEKIQSIARGALVRRGLEGRSQVRRQERKARR